MVAEQKLKLASFADCLPNESKCAQIGVDNVAKVREYAE
jgi:hypothetical protein